MTGKMFARMIIDCRTDQIKIFFAHSDPVLVFMFEEDALEQFGGKSITIRNICCVASLISLFSM